MRIPSAPSLLFTLLAGSLALPALADMPCGPMGGPMAPPGASRDNRMERHTLHHAHLHEALKLTPEQEPAWQALMASEPTPMPAPTEDWRSLPTPERAERMLTRMKAHEAQMSAHVDALKTFYATLTPEQKKTFDAAHAVGPRGMKGRMGPGMMGGGTGGRMSDRP
ncbi:MAG TPA: Spy/CpxP family protein refolding chaperone [Rhodocyclaceae bacterium]|nr:Spy/CpxP family protein refolding chaperone [Rhodocyclaceae bacterium]